MIGQARWTCGILLIATGAGAGPLPALGARSLAMGGTGVATATGPSAPWWNPAGLGITSAGGSLVYGRTTADPEELGVRLDDLAATAARRPDILDRPADASRAAALLAAIAAEPDAIDGVRASGAFYGSPHFGLSLVRLTLASATPSVDLVHTAPAADPATGIAFNSSALTLRSLEVDEYVLSFATPVGDPANLFGASVRHSRGRTHVSRPSLFDFPDFAASDVFGATTGGERDGASEWSFDAGALFTLHPTLRAGVSARYLGTPEFEAADGGRFRFDPRWRVGLALAPRTGWMFAADLDLDESTLADGAEGRRELALGGEYTLLQEKVSLRAGYRRALGGSDEGILTGGVGFQASGFTIDGAVAWSPDTRARTFLVELRFTQTNRDQ